MTDSSRRGILLFLLLLLVFLGPAGSSLAEPAEPLVINLADADSTLLGEDAGDWTAYFASPAGDVNGDGFGDAFIGAPMAGDKVCPYPLNEDGSCPGLPKGQGVAYLVLGRTQDEWPPSPLDLEYADASFLGCGVNSMTARQLYTAGDVNADGYDDLLVSGWKCGVNYTGKAYLFLGRPDVDSWGRYFPVEEADASFLGEHEGDFLSYYTATAGDVNADGYDDFLITSTHYDISGTEVITDAGKIYLILGRQAADWAGDYPVTLADASFLGEAEGDRIGRSATGVGDVNGDGYDDFLVGSISSDYAGVDAGQAYLFLGRATPSDPRYDPARPWWGQGCSVAGADASFVGEAEGDELGRRVAEAGDVNGDGYADFLVGAALSDRAAPDAGIAYLVVGRAEADWGMRYPMAQADASFVGEEARDQAGRRLNGVGDVNSDGYDDVLVGAPHNERGGILAGAAYLIYGQSAAAWGRYYSLSEADIVYVGKPDVGAAGYDMAWLGDYDGDHIDDYLIGAYGGRNNGEVPGEAYVLLGSEQPIPTRFLPDAPSYYLGWRRVTGEYLDPSGWEDLSTVELALGQDATDLTGPNLRYEAAGNAMFLLDDDTSNWLGPCTPGDAEILSNGPVELDCRGSFVEGRLRTLRITWRVRWSEPPSDASTLYAYLRGVDSSGDDSGVKEFPWAADVALDMRAAPPSHVFPGTPITYTLTFGNAGGAVANDVAISDLVPGELTDVAVSSTTSLTPVEGSPYSWAAGDIFPMQGGVITITGLVSPDLPSQHEFSHSATIAAAEPDDPRNNSASVTVVAGANTYLPLVRNEQ